MGSNHSKEEVQVLGATGLAIYSEECEMNTNGGVHKSENAHHKRTSDDRKTSKRLSLMNWSSKSRKKRHDQPLTSQGAKKGVSRNTSWQQSKNR